MTAGAVAEPASRRAARWSLLLTLPLLVELLLHAAGVLADTVLALGYRYQLDYGEGIVWQQALLMFGPQMYSPSTSLPFIVFHYPPFYHFAVRALMLLHLDPLFAGRLVSAASTYASAALIGLLVLAGVRGRIEARHVAFAIVAGLTFLCLNAVRSWGLWMRVDMLAVALGLIGTVIAVQTRCSTLGTTVALLFCLAAVFTKQTQLAAGLSVFAVAVVCAPRAAVLGAAVAGAVGVAGLAALELTTHGFLKNIVGYNINPISLKVAWLNVWLERGSAPFVVVMLLSAVTGIIGFRRSRLLGRLRERERAAMVQAMLLVHFVLAGIAALAIVKVGSSTNYFIDMMGAGSALIGLLLCSYAARPLLVGVVALSLALTTAKLSVRHYYRSDLRASTAENDRVATLIHQSDKPVESDDMVLLMRGGKSVVYEPAIVSALVTSGAWDPAPLLAMIADHGFGFMLVDGEESESGPVVNAAIEAAYPRTEVVRPLLVMRLPPAAGTP